MYKGIQLLFNSTQPHLYTMSEKHSHPLSAFHCVAHGGLLFCTLKSEPEKPNALLQKHTSEIDIHTVKTIIITFPAATNLQPQRITPNPLLME